MKRAVRRALARLGLLDNLTYLRARLRTVGRRGARANRKLRRQGAPDGLPIPPMRLVWVTIESPDLYTFLESGRRELQEVFVPLLTRNGRRVSAYESLLEFGCGCGRLLRHWHGLAQDAGPRLAGVDVDPRMVSWCERNLEFAEFTRNHLRPPLPFGDACFDLVYSRSVFTHLPESLQDEWLREIHRVLKPGGVLLFTVRGSSYRDVMCAVDAAAFDAGRFVVRDTDNPGRNECFAYHPDAYVRERWPELGFQVVDFEPGRRALPQFRFQDTYLARRIDANA